MSSWRELAAGIVGSRALPPSEEPSRGRVAIRAAGLPEWLVQDIEKLRTMRAPALDDRSAWRPVVADAVRLTSEGWTAQALALGWHPLEIFGCGKGDSGAFEGLAVWLRGRRIVLLDEASAIAAENERRFVFNRRRHFCDGGDGGGAVVFLWQFGRA